SVEKWLNALVLERCTTHYWVELNVDCTAAQKFTDLIVIWHIAIQVSFHCFFVDFNDLLDHQFAVFLCLISKISWNVAYFCSCANSFVNPNKCLHLDKVDNALKFVFCTDWKLDCNRDRTKTGL